MQNQPENVLKIFLKLFLKMNVFLCILYIFDQMSAWVLLIHL